MSNHAILNNIQHKDTRVITRCSAELGDAVMYSHIYPFEYRHIQADYPIVFAKNEQTDSYFSLALFGLEEAENLYLSAIFNRFSRCSEWSYDREKNGY